MREGVLSGRCVALTFDDGDASMAQYVEPYLRNYDLPATFFINSAYLERPKSYWFPILTYLSASAPERLPEELGAAAAQLRTTKDPAYYQRVREQVEDLAGSVPGLESRTVSREWLATLPPELFAIGLHGHEHQRFSMMSAEWQRRDLECNITELSQYTAYRPIFALPFGKSQDGSPETFRIAEELGLDVVLANGGVNLGSEGPWLRVPSDNVAMPAHLDRIVLESQFPRLAALV